MSVRTPVPGSAQHRHLHRTTTDHARLPLSGLPSGQTQVQRTPKIVIENVRIVAIPTTHLYRTPRYDWLVKDTARTSNVEEILGVNRDVAYLRTEIAYANGEDDADSLVINEVCAGRSFAVIEAGEKTLSFGPSAAYGRLQLHPRYLPADEAEHITPDRESDNQVKFTTNSKRELWLVYSDSFDTSWSATIEGKTTPIYPANLFAKAARVPSVLHLILFTFFPMA